MCTKMGKQVLLIGLGNSVHVMIGLFAASGVRVKVLTTFGNEAERFNKACPESGVKLKLPDGSFCTGMPHLVTNDPKIAVPGSDIIILSLPSFAHEGCLASIEPYIQPGMSIGAFPAEGIFVGINCIF